MNHYSWSRKDKDKAKTVVLCTGTDSVLLHTQKLILEQAGYPAITAKDRNTVMAACKQWVIDVAVVGTGLPQGKPRH